MKRNKHIFLFGTLIALFAVSCNVVELTKPEGATDAEGNRITKVEPAAIEATDVASFTKLIADSSSKSWEASFFTLAGSTQFTNCRLDDIMIFSTDGTYLYNGGTNLCGAEDSRASRNGTWEIDYDRKMVYFDKGTSREYVAEVIGLKNDEIRLKGVYMGMEVRGLYSFK